MNIYELIFVTTWNYTECNLFQRDARKCYSCKNAKVKFMLIKRTTPTQVGIDMQNKRCTRGYQKGADTDDTPPKCQWYFNLYEM